MSAIGPAVSHKLSYIININITMEVPTNSLQREKVNKGRWSTW